MRQPGVEAVVGAMKAKGYRLFEDGKENPIAIRSANSQAGRFDDWLCLLRKDNGNWYLRSWEGTTDPGLYFLKEYILSKLGTAILAEGQWRDTYKIDLHRGLYRALCQRLGPVKVYRDLDRDEILDCDPNTFEEGFFGINVHRDAYSSASEKVIKASAGCLVFQRKADFEDFMDDIERSARNFGNVFDLTLLKERDLRAFEAGSVSPEAVQPASTEPGLQWHEGKASSFADPKDIAAFKRAKAKGMSDKQAFKYGDNGLGCWGDDTTKPVPMCALPREDWAGVAKPRGKEVLVEYKGQQVVCELRDTMPAKRFIINGAVIDLNPAACKAFGLTPPALVSGVKWRWA